MDSAFFSDEIVHALESEGVEFTISVPFERFPDLKQQIKSRRSWRLCGEAVPTDQTNIRGSPQEARADKLLSRTLKRRESTSSPPFCTHYQKRLAKT